ncbi:MAG: Ldh family oxidoreductase [Aestuariivirgaceae bacterium]
MSVRPTIRIEARALERLARDLLVAAGADPRHAEIAAELFVEADLHGVGAQGVDYLYYAMDGLKRGLIDGSATPTIARETASSVLIDGRRGIGQVAALLAVDLLARKARETGTATVAIGNSTDIFRIGAFAMRLAKAGLIGFVTTSGPPLVHPHGGRERLLSTNPLAIGIPRRGEPFMLDMATSALASSRARQAAYYGEEVPPGSGLDSAGRPTNDARAIRQGGALSPLGGHKGFGLALAMALLCGPLSGSGIGPELAGWQAEGETRTQGHFFFAIDPASLVDPQEFLDRTEWYIDVIKSSALAEGHDAIHIPFERSAAAARHQGEHGIAVLDETWRVLQRLAAENGVAMPTPM